MKAWNYTHCFVCSAWKGFSFLQRILFLDLIGCSFYLSGVVLNPNWTYENFGVCLPSADTHVLSPECQVIVTFARLFDGRNCVVIFGIVLALFTKDPNTRWWFCASIATWCLYMPLILCIYSPVFTSIQVGTISALLLFAGLYSIGLFKEFNVAKRKMQ
jgi:hypothetical protein